MRPGGPVEWTRLAGLRRSAGVTRQWFCLLDTHSSGPRKGDQMTARTYESLASAAARMGVSVKTVRRRIADGVLPVYRCGRILRLDPNDVDGMFCRYPQLTVAALGSTGRRPARRPGWLRPSLARPRRPSQQFSEAEGGPRNEPATELGIGTSGGCYSL